jgi:chemotaxis protein MotB
MFQRRDTSGESSNFWISYADLMAGLLFVFILLIGAIVSKSILMRQDLHAKEARLAQTRQNLEAKRKTLDQTQSRLAQTQKALEEKRKKLDVTQTRLTQLQKTLKERETLLQQRGKDLNQTRTTVRTQKQTIQRQAEQIRLQKAEVDKLHRLLADLQAENREQKTALQSARNRAEDLNRSIVLTHKSLKLKEKELERLNQLLLARNAKVDTLNGKIVLLQNLLNETNTTLQNKKKKLQEYVGKVVILSNQLTDKEDELTLKDQKLADVLTALDEKKTRYDDLLARLKKQRAQIRSLTGIQLKVIAELKKTLGDKIDIDRSSGALRLSSNILFDKGQSTLKESAKSELARAFNDYIAALVTNEAIRPHLDRIVIEGHTDSDGTYLYNLKLSQERALAVMNYLLTLPIARKYDLRKYLVASGRAYLDPVVRNGLEDKEASRRIEIKFQLKNRDAMHEIERILDAQ